MNKDTTLDYFKRLSEQYSKGVFDSLYSSKIADEFVVFSGGQCKASWVPLDFGEFARCYIHEEKAGFCVDKHKHDSSTFRFILSGRIVINGESYTAGDWIFIPANFVYDFKVEEDTKLLFKCNRSWEDLPDW